MDTLAWDLLEQVFTAETLMTARDELRTWERGTDLSPIHEEARKQHYDLIPVTENGRIVAVLRTGATEAEPLRDQWLVSRDTGIPDLLTIFAKSRRPAFLVFHRQDVVGLVTPADFNKLPARIYVYNLVGELELALASCIRNHFGEDSERILQRLSKGRRHDLEEDHGELIHGNVDIDVVQLLDLSDLVNIVIKRKELREELGFPSGNQAKNALNSLVDLRNRTMHLVRPLLERIPEDLLRLDDRLRRAECILQRLNG
jgi:hypothetical protein